MYHTPQVRFLLWFYLCTLHVKLGYGTIHPKVKWSKDKIVILSVLSGEWEVRRHTTTYNTLAALCHPHQVNLAPGCERDGKDSLTPVPYPSHTSPMPVIHHSCSFTRHYPASHTPPRAFLLPVMRRLTTKLELTPWNWNIIISVRALRNIEYFLYSLPNCRQAKYDVLSLLS